MTMTEIVVPETGIDHIVEIDHNTTTKMTIEKKIIGRSKIGNREVDIEIIMETCVMTGTLIIVEIHTKKIVIKINIETNIEMLAMTVIEVGLGKNIAYIMLEKIMVLLVTIQRLNNCTKPCNS